MSGGWNAEGALFAWSGMDGPTDSRSGMVATLLEQASLRLHTHPSIDLFIEPDAGSQWRTVLAVSDLLLATVDNDPLGIAWSCWHTLTAVFPPSVQWRLAAQARPCTSEGVTLLEVETGWIAVTSGEFLTLSFGYTTEQALARCHEAVQSDPPALWQRRMEQYARFTRRLPDNWHDLGLKCISVMRVNTLHPEGSIPYRWSTPDRLPHRHMWLWDSAFHSIGMNHLDPGLAWDFLDSVFAQCNEDGMIAHEMHVDGFRTDITQPPILAMAVWENYQRTADTECLRAALPVLQSHLSWILKHRARPQGLLGWQRGDGITCRCAESGMDNSPRFDAPGDGDDIDLCVYAACDMRYIAMIAAELGEASTASHWLARAEALESAIHRLLWRDDWGLYSDRDVAGQWIPVEAVSGLLPLLLPSTPSDRVRRMVEALHDPQRFGAPYPLPSVALRDLTWQPDMWRGPVWVNMIWFIWRGLRLHGCTAEASSIRHAALHMVDQAYRNHGVLFEFYPVDTHTPPTRLHRKGPAKEVYSLSGKFDNIRDYHWTAALTLDLILSTTMA